VFGGSRGELFQVGEATKGCPRRATEPRPGSEKPSGYWDRETNHAVPRGRSRLVGDRSRLVRPDTARGPVWLGRVTRVLRWGRQVPVRAGEAA
jgi:hypothetical protein